MKKAIIFDIGGVLRDSKEVMHKAFKKALKKKEFILI